MIKAVLKILLLICLALFMALTPSALDGALKEESEQREDVVLVLWHVDSFEGGTGSRADFLIKTVTQFRKEHGDVFISVITHTEESMTAAFEKGFAPDLISFGTPADGVFERAKPLKSHKNGTFFESGEVNGTAYFYPYAYGRYVLFQSDSPRAEEKILSKGRGSLAQFMAKMGKFEGKVSDTTSAYSAFAAGKAKEMLGTQRDVYRLTVRGVSFTSQPFGDATELVQYVAVTAEEGRRRAIAEQFAAYLISDDVQQRLGEIGLFSPTGQEVDYGLPEMNALSQSPPKRVLSPFLDGEKKRELYSADGQDDFFEKFANYLV